MTAAIAAFARKDRIDQRLLIDAALLHLFVAAAVHVLPFGRLRRLLHLIGDAGVPSDIPVDISARIVQAVQTVSARLPGGNCLTDALIAQCLLAGHACETTLCFGIGRQRPAHRPFDAHAWLESHTRHLIGARAIVYDRLRHPGRCASSPSPR